MKRLLILIRPSPQATVRLLEAAADNDISMKELLPNVFVATSGPLGVLEAPLKKQLASSSTAYVLASYTAARANSDHWTNALGPYGESRVGEPSDQDTYILLHRVGGDAHVLGLTDEFARLGVSAKERARGVYVARPSNAQASHFSAKLGAIVEGLDGDTAIVRIHPFTSSVPI